ncbi:hypothetical protein [Aquimarina sediminis]|uniref:hypothetical protein n=1 Tax=Aquimarina sediminis TaxID=2070536 RepID=UPI000CA03179|nr:hypothetical protein [Aquimarina sediminis]
MKKLYILIAVFYVINLTAQEPPSSPKVMKSFVILNYKEVYKWEGFTRNNVLVFGVTKTKEDAKTIIDDFNTRNWHTNYRILHFNIVKDTVKHKGYEDYFTVFNERFPKGYYLLSIKEHLATEIYEKEGLFAAIEYYRKAKEIPYLASKNHLENLLYNLSQYRIDFTFNKEVEGH